MPNNTPRLGMVYCWLIDSIYTDRKHNMITCTCCFGNFGRSCVHCCHLAGKHSNYIRSTWIHSLSLQELPLVSGGIQTSTAWTWLNGFGNPGCLQVDALLVAKHASSVLLVSQLIHDIMLRDPGGSRTRLTGPPKGQGSTLHTAAKRNLWEPQRYSPLPKDTISDL